MATVTVLLEVIERNTCVGLLPIEERQVELRYDSEMDLFVADRAKRSYLGDVEKRIQYEPRLRETLNGRDWYIDCVILN